MAFRIFQKKERPPLDERRAVEALRGVSASGLERDIVSHGFVRGLRVARNRVALTLELPPAAAGLRETLKKRAAKALHKAGAEAVEADVRVAAPRRPAGKRAIPGVARLLAVASGKGGVGKSTVSYGLARAMAAEGRRVGLLDCDIYGPSVPVLTGVGQKPAVDDERRIQPLVRDGIKLMSMGFLVESGRNVSWRGPMLSKMLQQFLYDVAWGELDCLILDLPPGTGDVQLSLAQQAPISAGLVATTPQAVALADARKGVQMFLTMKTPVLGFVENMSGYICRKCQKRHPIFRDHGARRLAEEFQLPLLAEIPLVADVQRQPEILAPYFAALARKAVEGMEALRTQVGEAWATPGPGSFEV